jgi:hypothetical protein
MWPECGHRPKSLIDNRLPGIRARRSARSLTDAMRLSNLVFVTRGIELKTPVRTRTSVAAQLESRSDGELQRTLGHVYLSTLFKIPLTGMLGMEGPGTDPACMTDCSNDTYDRGDPDEF